MWVANKEFIGMVGSDNVSKLPQQGTDRKISSEAQELGSKEGRRELNLSASNGQHQHRKRWEA